ncbi:MAG: Holliday junction resolvase RuvX [Methylococcaceae bacterium]|jgi:putative Holliday junction resolvase
MADRQSDFTNATYLGFDFGEKKTGVAVGQRITGTARGLDTIRNTSEQAFWLAVSKLVETWQPSAFVVGIPIPSEPHKDPQNHIVPLIKAFCSELEQRYQRPVHTMDETLSTRESQTLFYNQRVRKSVQFADIKDELAAQLILQTWLSHTEPRPTE